MCFGGNDGSEEAARARADEEARQARIKAGTQRINGIFDGTTKGAGAVAADAAYNPTGTYYNADGSVWTPTAASTYGGGFSGPRTTTPNRGGGAGRGRDSGVSPGRGGFFGGYSGSYGSTGLTPEQQFAKMRAEGKLFSGTEKTAAFDDAFFKGRRDAFTNFATPQLEDQYGKTQRELIFSLDRSGNLDSSARGEKMSDLQQMYDIQKQGVADKALSYETTARNSVEDARANLIATLNATGDAEGAAKSALARSQALSAPPAYDPLGQLFTDFTNTLGIQAAQERSYAAGGPKPAYSTGLFANRGRTTVSA
jgi:hypothetical protein